MVTYYNVSFSVIINYVVCVARRCLTCFYIIRGDKIKNDYIKHYKKGTCMAICKGGHG
jgi:hypothetical protein